MLYASDSGNFVRTFGKYELLRWYVVMNNTPSNKDISNEVCHEFSEDVLDFLALLLEEYLRVEKLNNAPPK